MITQIFLGGIQNEQNSPVASRVRSRRDCRSCQRPLKDRNNSAHSNGQIYFRTEQGIAAKVAEVLRVTREIEEHSKPVIEEPYRDFLTSSFDPDDRRYSDTLDQIREELVHAKYFSQKDMAICRSFEVAQLTDNASFKMIEALHRTRCESYF